MSLILKRFSIIFFCVLHLNSFCQITDVLEIPMDDIADMETVEEPRDYYFIVNRRVTPLKLAEVDAVPYFSFHSVLSPLKSVGVENSFLDKNTAEITFDGSTYRIDFTTLQISFIPPPENPEDSTESDKITDKDAEEKEQEVDNREILKHPLVFSAEKIMDEWYVNFDFILNILPEIIKLDTGFESNTSTFFIGADKQLKINFTLKEENEYSVLSILCPADIKYTAEQNESLLTVSINSRFNIREEDISQIESTFFNIIEYSTSSHSTVLKLELLEKTDTFSDHFEHNFSKLKLYFYSENYYTPDSDISQTVELYKGKSQKIKKIIIDPGHGGIDKGAIGKKGVMEKEITLSISYKLAEILQQRGYDVALTRYSDIFIPLEDRTGFANNNKGDLFISIHVNASVRKATGAETYYLSLDGMEDVSDTVSFENRTFNHTSEESNDSPANDLSFILWDLAQTEYMKDSANLAEEIQKSMNTLTGIRDRGIRQASLIVLKGLNMPGVLVEVAFISNPREELKLSKDSFQRNTARAIADSIDSYKYKYELRMEKLAAEQAQSESDEAVSENDE